MQIIASHVFGPGNIHARCRTAQIELKGAAGVTIPSENLKSLAQAMQRIRAEAVNYAAWRRLMRAERAVPVAAVVEIGALLAQRYMSWPVRFASWRETPSASHPDRTSQFEEAGFAIYEISSDEPGKAAANVGLALAEKLIAGASASEIFKVFAKEMRAFEKKTARETPASDALMIAEKAASYGIPWSVVEQSQFLRLGWGARSHILKGTESTNTRSINRALSRDKGMSNRILRQAGIPVAQQHIARNAKEAAALAATIGYPLVVKPRDGNMGKGITIGVRDKKHLERAFARAQLISQNVALETLLKGEEYRLVTVNNQLVSAVHRRAARVTGDGKSTIAQLVRRENLNRDREPVLKSTMTLVLDESAIELLAEQGFTPQSIPANGQPAYLRRESNVSRGGDAVDITHQLHPDNAELAIRAARIIGLDISGVDFITPDPAVSWRENGGAICEINSRPGIAINIHAAPELSDRILKSIVEMYYPKGETARIPAIVLLGSGQQTRLLREHIETAAAQSGKVLGVILSDPDAAPARPLTQKLLRMSALVADSCIDIALIEATPEQIVGQGLGAEQVDLVVLAAGDAADEQERAARAALTRVAPDGMIAANDPGCLDRIADVLGVTFAQPVMAATGNLGKHAAPVERPEPDKTSFSVTFLGDIGFGESYMSHPRTRNLQRHLATHGHGYSLANLRGILSLSDLNIANLEVALCNRPDVGLQGRKKYLGWCDPLRTTAALKQAGIDAVSLANNHILDCGTVGLAETLSRLQGVGISSFGAGSDADDASFPFIHRFSIGSDERSLVVFSGFEYRGRYDRRYRWYTQGSRPGVAMLAPEQIASQIKALRDVLPNPTFVAFPHWGTDYQDTNDSQREQATQLVAAGIDLIVGHGTHTVQPPEIVGGVPVIYNIGNFIWNTPGRFNKREVLPLGCAVRLSFNRRQRFGPRLSLYPIIVDNDLTDFQNRPVDEAEFTQAARFLTSRLQGRARRYSDSAGHFIDIAMKPRTAVSPDTAPKSELVASL